MLLSASCPAPCRPGRAVALLGRGPALPQCNPSSSRVLMNNKKRLVLAAAGEDQQINGTASPAPSAPAAANPAPATPTAAASTAETSPTEAIRAAKAQARSSSASRQARVQASSQAKAEEGSNKLGVVAGAVAAGALILVALYRQFFLSKAQSAVQGATKAVEVRSFLNSDLLHLGPGATGSGCSRC